MSPRLRDHRHGERGAALVMALLTAAIVLALVFSLSAGASRAAQSTSGSIEQQRALLSARAGVWAAANFLSQGGDALLPGVGDQVGLAGRVEEADHALQTQADVDGDGTATPLADADGDGVLDFSHRGAFAGRRGYFEARARREGGGVIYVRARGGDGETVRTVEAWLERDPSGSSPFRRAVFSDQDLQLHSEVFTDSYDSQLVGPYAAHTRYQAFDDNGNPAQWAGLPVFLASVTGLPGGARGEVASNGAIQLWSGAFVYGDARPGPSAVLDLGGTGQNHVEGVTTPLTAPLEFPLPDLTLPAAPANAAYGLPAPGAALTVDATDLVLDVRGQGRVQLQLSQVRLKSGGSLTVLGDPGQVVELHLTSTDERSLELDSGSRVRLSPPGQAAGPTLEVRTAGGLDVNSDSDLNADGDPAQLQLYSGLVDPTKAVRLNSKAVSRAAIYAPGAGLEFNAKCEFFGAVVAARVRFNSMILFHYDEALADMVAGPLPPPLYVPRVTREAR